eukprot:gene9297-11935_t
MEDLTTEEAPAKESTEIVKPTAKDVKDEAGSKASGEEEPGGEEAPQMPPIMLFFQPISLESILETTLSIADYRTFSYIMRMKVRQRRVMRELEEKVSVQAQKASDRKRKLNAQRNIDGYYEELIERMCGLTPHRPDIVEYTKQSYTLEKWQTMLKGDLTDQKVKDEFKGLMVSILMRLSQLGSIDEIQAIRKHTNDLVVAIDIIDGTNEEIASRFLLTAHDFIDKTETKIYEAYKARLEKPPKKEDSVRAAKLLDDEEE